MCGILLSGCDAPVNDITTDLEHPPVYMKSPPEDVRYDPASHRAIQELKYPDLKSLAATWPEDEAFARVLTVIRRREWTIVAIDERKHRVQAVAVTFLLRLREDVMIEVRPALATSPMGVQSVIAMRSKSRLGRNDFGTNNRRILAFFRDLQAAP